MAGDNIVAVVVDDADTTVTSPFAQEFTDATAFGGATPKAAMFFLCGATALDTLSAPALMSMGVCQSDRQFCVTGDSADSAAVSDAVCVARNDAVMELLNTTADTTDIAADATGDGTGSNPGPIANGWRIRWTEQPASAFRIMCVLFGGSDMSVDCNVFELNTTENGTTTITPGFQADTIFFMSCQDDFGSGNTPRAHHYQNMGCMVASGGTINKQNTAGWADRNAVGSTASGAHLIDDISGADRCISVISFNGAISFTGEVTSLTSTQAVITSRDGAPGTGGNGVCYLALKLDGSKVDLQNIFYGATASPTDVASASLGFTPRAVISAQNGVRAVDTNYASSPMSDTWGVGAASSDSSTQGYIGLTVDDAAGDSITKSVAEDTIIDQYRVGLTKNIQANLKTYGSDTYTLEVTTAGSGAADVVSWFWSIGEAAAGGVPSGLSLLGVGT